MKIKTTYLVRFIVSDDIGNIVLQESFNCYNEAKSYREKLETFINLDISDFTDKTLKCSRLEKVVGLFKLYEESLY